MTHLKQLVFTIGVLVCMTLTAVGQDNDNFQKIESQKIAYITKQLKLTPTEAQKFFPLYNQYSKEIRNIKNAKSNITSSSARSGKDVIEFDAKEVDIKKQYRTRFSDVIGSARASQFFVLEQEFKDLLYKEWQNRKKD